MPTQPGVNPITASVKAIRRFVANTVQLFVRRPEGSTSRLGLILQVLGLSAALYGLFLWSPPLAFVIGGVLAIVIGERV